MAAVITLTALALAACSSGGAGNGGSGDKSPIKIAGLYDITGGNAAAGAPVSTAIQSLVDQLNAAGGVNGHKIEYSTYDTATDPATTQLQYQKALSKGEELMVSAPPLSAASGPLCEQANADGTLVYMGGVTSPASTTPFKKYCFAVPQTATVSGQAIATFLQSMKVKNIGLITDRSQYGAQANAALQDALQGTGITIGATAEVAVDGNDATNQAQAMKQAGVEAVVLGALPQPGTAAIKSMSDQSVGVPMISFAGVFVPSTAELLTSSAPIEFYMVSPANCPQWQFFKECGQEAAQVYNNQQTSAYAILAYYAIKGFFDALATTDDYSPDGVVEALEKTKIENSFSLPVTFSGDSHLGLSKQLLEGYKGGKGYFFGGSITENQLKQ